MSIGKRRLRLSRAQLRPSAATVSIKQDRQARQRTRAVRLALVIASLVATAAIVHGSGPPFTYRLGERADREIRVNVKEFRIRNQTKTSNERQAAADQVPPVMVNDPAQMLELADRLDDLTVTIAKAARSRTSATPSGRPGSSGRRSSPRSSRPSPRRTGATRCTRRSSRPSGRSPATACSAPAPCRRTRNRAGRCRSAPRASPRPWPDWSRASGSSPSAWPSPRGPSTRNSARRSPRRGSARSSSA